MSEDTIAIDGTKARRFVKEIEKHDATIESYKGEHAQRCKSVNELKSGVYDLAADAGIAKKALRAIVKARALKRKLAETRENLEEHVETFDLIAAAIGEDFAALPLGEAALNAARTKAEANGAALDELTGDDEGEKDVRPRQLKQREKDRKADAAASAH